MIEINGKVYRNIQEQVGENQENIEDLDTRVTALEESPAPTVDAYTKAEADAKFQTIAGMSTYATKSETITKDENGNVNGVLQVAHVQSESWDEDDDCKADIYLSSGLRRSTLRLESDGEETGSSITLQGTTSVDSEGTIEIAGETNFVTENRLTVNGTEEVAYLSDITDAGFITDTSGTYETWTFTLANNTTVTKNVKVK